MSQYEILNAGIVNLSGKNANIAAQVRVTDQTTRATVYAEVDDGINDPPIGSLILVNSTTGKGYIRTAAAGAATDFQKITTTAAD
jgi:hypothetical protein